jgi:3-isopropylmalate/(R)-2-methylmalate dehydratase small subunit
MEKFTVLRGIAAPMPLANINTDAISPSSAGQSVSVDLGAMLFANWRYVAGGAENPGFVLNQARFRQSKILVGGTNFGCGSSRERAVWALISFGIRCVVAPSFGEIFQENCFQNGLLPVTLPAAECAALGQALADAAEPVVTVDLERGFLGWPDGRISPIAISPERRTALLEGLDEIDVILRMEADIADFQNADRAARPWIYQSP